MGRQSKAPSGLGGGEGPGDWSGFFAQALVLAVTLLFCHSGAPSPGAGGVSVSFSREAWVPQGALTVAMASFPGNTCCAP